MKTLVIGMDTARHVFQLYAVDVATGKVDRVKLKHRLRHPHAARNRDIDSCRGHGSEGWCLAADDLSG